VVKSIAWVYRGVVLLVVILRAAIEAVETIGHHQASKFPGIKRMLPARRGGSGAAAAAMVEEKE